MPLSLVFACWWVSIRGVDQKWQQLLACAAFFIFPACSIFATCIEQHCNWKLEGTGMLAFTARNSQIIHKGGYCRWDLLKKLEGKKDKIWITLLPILNVLLLYQSWHQGSEGWHLPFSRIMLSVCHLECKCLPNGCSGHKPGFSPPHSPVLNPGPNTLSLSLHLNSSPAFFLTHFWNKFLQFYVFFFFLSLHF